MPGLTMKWTSPGALPNPEPVIRTGSLGCPSLTLNEVMVGLATVCGGFDPAAPMSLDCEVPVVCFVASLSFDIAMGLMATSEPLACSCGLAILAGIAEDCAACALSCCSRV